MGGKTLVSTSLLEACACVSLWTCRCDCGDLDLECNRRLQWKIDTILVVLRAIARTGSTNGRMKIHVVGWVRSSSMCLTDYNRNSGIIPPISSHFLFFLNLYVLTNRNMTTTSTHQIGAALLSMMASAMAFAPTITPLAALHRPTASSSSSQLQVAVDPSVASTKEYQDVCGNIFGEDEMMSRLQKTNYLYPRHVEVIEDLSEMAGEMTDKIVSASLHCELLCAV